uniref:Leucine-rich repeat-containing N-terminal plant-type domain-containing protein n=1 Tax=Leersia perrieri TaxID=77586 RepID=A0A0D9V2N2_9ORYZ
MGFHGRVPHQLGNLSNLQYLDITVGLYPPMHAADISWLACLSSLMYLDMSYVNLSSVVDWVRPINMLSHLEVLRLKGVTPSWVWSMKTLKMLNLETCELSSSFPDGLGNLTLLEGLNLGSNSFKGTLPSTLNNTCNLRVLDLNNNLIGVEIKDLMDKLPSCTRNKFEELYLSYNDITGNLDWLGSQTSLRSLYLSDNKFSGHLPLVIREMAKLSTLFLSNN